MLGGSPEVSPLCADGEVSILFFCLCTEYLSYHTTHTTTAERRADKQCQRRSASSVQKTKSGIEGEDPAAAGIERFFSLKGPRDENNVRFGLTPVPPG